jgi:hypothetical protein
MSRFADWRARRRNTSRRTARTAGSHPASNGVAQPAILAPATGSHLSDGVVVQTHLEARLLGVRLLRVDGVVHLAPARLECGDPGPPPPQEAELIVGADLHRASRLLEDGDRRLRRGQGRRGPSLSLAPPSGLS